MSATSPAAWKHWLDQVRRHLHATPNTQADADDWAALFGHLTPEAMIELRLAVLVDETCARLGRVHPADAVRILRARQAALLPSFDEVYSDALDAVAGAGWTAGADGFETVAQFRYPMTAAVIAGYGGWLELCQSDDPDNRRAQMRRVHTEVAQRWTTGPWTVHCRASFRWVLADGSGFGGALVNGEAAPPPAWLERARLDSRRPVLEVAPPPPEGEIVEDLPRLRALMAQALRKVPD